MSVKKIGSLHQKTLDLMIKSDLSIHEISMQTGITYAFLTRLINGKVRKPSVDHIQVIYEELSGKKLEL